MKTTTLIGLIGSFYLLGVLVWRSTLKLSESSKAETSSALNQQKPKYRVFVARFPLSMLKAFEKPGSTFEPYGSVQIIETGVLGSSDTRVPTRFSFRYEDVPSIEKDFSLGRFRSVGSYAVCAVVVRVQDQGERSLTMRFVDFGKGPREIYDDSDLANKEQTKNSDYPLVFSTKSQVTLLPLYIAHALEANTEAPAWSDIGQRNTLKKPMLIISFGKFLKAIELSWGKSQRRQTLSFDEAWNSPLAFDLNASAHP